MGSATSPEARAVEQGVAADGACAPPLNAIAFDNHLAVVAAI